MAKSPFYKVYLDSAEGRDITEWVESMHYEDAVKEDSVLELKLYDEFRLTVLNDPDIISGKVLAFQFGFLGGEVSPIHRVVITDIEPDYSESISVTLKGLDAGHRLKKNTSCKIWVGKTTSQIAREIATRNGLESEIEDSGHVWPNMPQGNKSDYEFLHYLSMRELDGNFVFFVRNEKLYFVRRGLDKASLFLYTYGVDENIKSFRPTYKESTASGAHGKSKHAGTDHSAKTTAGSSADAKTQKNNIATSDFNTVFNEDAIAVGIRKVKNGQVVQVISDGVDGVMGFVSEVGKTLATPTDGQAEALNLVNSHKKKATLAVLTGPLTTDGQPLAQPDEMVTISGVSDRDKGNWYVVKVSHTINTSGYETVQELEKNGVKRRIGYLAGVVNRSIGKKSGNGVDERVINVRDQDGNLVGEKTVSGNFIPVANSQHELNGN